MKRFPKSVYTRKDILLASKYIPQPTRKISNKNTVKRISEVDTEEVIG